MRMGGRRYGPLRQSGIDLLHHQVRLSWFRDVYRLEYVVIGEEQFGSFQGAIISPYQGCGTYLLSLSRFSDFQSGLIISLYRFSLSRNPKKGADLDREVAISILEKLEYLIVPIGLLPNELINHLLPLLSVTMLECFLNDVRSEFMSSHYLSALISDCKERRKGIYYLEGDL